MVLNSNLAVVSQGLSLALVSSLGIVSTGSLFSFLSLIRHDGQWAELQHLLEPKGFSWNRIEGICATNFEDQGILLGDILWQGWVEHRLGNPWATPLTWGAIFFLKLYRCSYSLETTTTWIHDYNCQWCCMLSCVRLLLLDIVLNSFYFLLFILKIWRFIYFCVYECFVCM